jgi:LysM repeat protein
MKRILVWFLIISFSSVVARAQDAGTQQQLDRLSGQIQDLLDAQAAQGKRIEALEKEIGDLHDSSNPSGGDAANPDDLKKLAGQVQEIDKKRQADNERVLKELERLEKAMGVTPSGHKSAPDTTAPDTIPTPTPVKSHSTASGGGQTGYDYEIHKGDTLSAVAKAYREQGIKVTADEILKANPGLDPKTMKVGQKIFIPGPAQ